MTKVCIFKSMVFPVVIYGCKSWTVKKADLRRIDAFELWCWRRLSWESLGQQGDQTVNPKGSQLWIFVERTDAEAPILFPHDAKSQLIGKDPYFRKDWGQEAKGETEHKMVGWYHWLNGYESNSWRWWRTGKPGVLQSMRSQKVRHNWVTEQQQHLFYTLLFSDILWYIPYCWTKTGSAIYWVGWRKWEVPLIT